MTANAATFIKVFSKREFNLFANIPNSIKRGQVPRTKENIIDAEYNGFPVPKARAIMAWVVPQGIKIVIAPTRAGANISLLFDSFLTMRSRNLGGWITKYLNKG